MSGKASKNTKTVIWKAEHPLYTRVVDPEHFGVSKTYVFGRDTKHTAEMDESDLAILMKSPDAEFFTVAPVE